MTVSDSANLLAHNLIDTTQALRKINPLFIIHHLLIMQYIHILPDQHLHLQIDLEGALIQLISLDRVAHSLT